MPTAALAILCRHERASEMPLELEGSHRYGIVLAVALTTVLFLIIANEAPWSHGVSLLLSGGMLAVVIATSRGSRRLREWASVALTALTLMLVVIAVTDAGPESIASAASAALILATVVQLVRGLAVCCACAA